MIIKNLGGFITPGFPPNHHLDWHCIGSDCGSIQSGIKDALAAAEAEERK